MKAKEAGVRFIEFPEHKPSAGLDMTGKVYHHLTVIKPTKYDLKYYHWYYLCQCDCGKTFECSTWSWSRMSAKSCGCRRSIEAKERAAVKMAEREAAKEKEIESLKIKLESNGLERWLNNTKPGYSENKGNAEWQLLSGDSRKHRLANVTDIGTWEKERLARKSSRPIIERRNKARNYDPYGGLPFGNFGSVTICE